MYIPICCQFHHYTVNLSTSKCIQAKINKGLCAFISEFLCSCDNLYDTKQRNLGATSSYNKKQCTTGVYRKKKCFYSPMEFFPKIYKL